VSKLFQISSFKWFLPGSKSPETTSLEKGEGAEAQELNTSTHLASAATAFKTRHTTHAAVQRSVHYYIIIPKAGAAEEAAAWVPRLRPRLKMREGGSKPAFVAVMNRF
jgi:hypothetical protein